MRKLLLALPIGLALMLVGGLVAVADTTTPLPSASAAPVAPPLAPSTTCDARQNIETGGTGVNALIALPCLRGHNDPTLFEKYPATAYTLHTSSRPDGNIPNDIGNALAGWGFAAITWMGTICAGMLEWTFSLELAGGVNTALNANGVLSSVVKGLGDTLYKPFFVSAVLIAGIWITWHGLLRRRMTVTMESAGWVLLAASVAAFFLAAPAAAVGSLDSLSLNASRVILGTVSQADPEISSPSTQSMYGLDPNVRQYAGLRAAVNRYWLIYVYKPWEVAEFGNIDVAEQKAPNGMTLAEWDLRARASGDATEQQQVNAAIQSRLSGPGNQAYKDWYEGAQGSQRFALAVIALIIITIATVLLIAVAGAVLLAQLGLVLLTMVAPLFFLIGIQPSTGRRIFLRWGELMLSFAFRRVLYAAFLSVVLVLGGMIIGGVANRSWFLASVLQLALVIAAFMYRKPVAAVFSQVGAGKLEPLVAPHREQAVDWGRRQADKIGERLGIGSLRQGPSEGSRVDERVIAQWRARQRKGATATGTAGGAARASGKAAEAGPAPTAVAAATGAAGAVAIEGVELGRKALGAGKKVKEKGEKATARSVEAFIVEDDDSSAPAWPRPNRGGSLPQDEVEERAEQRRRILRDTDDSLQTSDARGRLTRDPRPRRERPIREIKLIPPPKSPRPTNVEDD